MDETNLIIKLIRKLNFIKPVILVRLYGGLGNQLFTYAAAYRLAKFNNCDLLVDTRSGFIRDHKYKRKFSLNSFSISVNKIDIPDFLSYVLAYLIPFLNKVNQKLPFQKRILIVRDTIGFDEDLLNLKVNSLILFEGCWQSEKYFKDVEMEIRTQFTFFKSTTEFFESIHKSINFRNSIAIHVRHFKDEFNPNQGNILDSYYERAIDYFNRKYSDAQFWLFSDNPSSAKKRLFTNNNNCILVSEKFNNLTDIQELYLMTQFSHFIISNSTYSWWGAWLSNKVDKIIVAPNERIESGEGLWGFDGLLPDEWIKL